jgi:ornithine--oxo-acid transaminase
MSQQDFIDKEMQYVAHNYASAKIVIDKGERIYLYDTEGRKYYDFLCGYSACNQGHLHPKIVKSLTD